eukprot:GHVQ01015672.1.p1 GENE.GHVQ01015672.1~~GHVQ01015672.1.p1  ORF type:complete len:179 (-),score=26.40 GHVQ01015672.1:431-967(-)
MKVTEAASVRRDEEEVRSVYGIEVSTQSRLVAVLLRELDVIDRSRRFGWCKTKEMKQGGGGGNIFCVFVIGTTTSRQLLDQRILKTYRLSSVYRTRDPDQWTYHDYLQMLQRCLPSYLRQEFVLRPVCSMLTGSPAAIVALCREAGVIAVHRLSQSTLNEPPRLTIQDLMQAAAGVCL